MLPSLGVGPDGTVHIAASTRFPAEIFYMKFIQSSGWTQTEFVSTESTSGSYVPSLGVGPDGTVHIAWTDYTDYGGAGTDGDIFYKRLEQGTGWITTEVISRESTSDSSYPSLGVGSDGTVHIAWEEQTKIISFDEDIYYKRLELDIGAPITVDDYDDQWHNADFTITLTATDNDGVAETFYKINEGPTMSVSTDGQPTITTEGADNTLEYWSVDKNTNEEIPHKTLTGIKLDKTPPTSYIEINQGETTTDSISVTLSLIAQDNQSQIVETRLSNDGISWVTLPYYSTSEIWSLTEGEGPKVVYVQFKNEAGLESAIISDTITYGSGTGSSLITCSLTPTTITTQEKATISGSLAPALQGASISILARPSGGTWTTIATAITQQDGSYSYVWSPTTTGTWEFMASWSGNTENPSCQSTTQSITINSPTEEENDADFPWAYLIVGIILAAAAAGIAVYFFMKQKKTSNPQPSEQPSAHTFGEVTK